MNWLKWVFLFGQVQIHYFYFSVSNQYHVYIRPFPFSEQTISIASFLHMGCLYMHCLFSLLATALFASRRYSKMYILLVCLDIVWVANFFARYGEDFLLPSFTMISVKALLYLAIIGLYHAGLKHLRYDAS